MVYQSLSRVSPTEVLVHTHVAKGVLGSVQKLEEVVNHYKEFLDIQENPYVESEFNKEYSVHSSSGNSIIKIDMWYEKEWIATIPDCDGEVNEFSAPPDVVVKELTYFFEQIIQEDKEHQERMKKVFYMIFAPHKESLDIASTYVPNKIDFGGYGEDDCLMKISLVPNENEEHTISIKEDSSIFDIQAQEKIHNIVCNEERKTLNLNAAKTYLNEYIQKIIQKVKK